MLNFVSRHHLWHRGYPSHVQPRKNPCGVMKPQGIYFGFKQMKVPFLPVLRNRTITEKLYLSDMRIFISNTLEYRFHMRPYSRWAMMQIIRNSTKWLGYFRLCDVIKPSMKSNLLLWSTKVHSLDFSGTLTGIIFRKVYMNYASIIRQLFFCFPKVLIWAPHIEQMLGIPL